MRLLLSVLSLALCLFASSASAQGMRLEPPAQLSARSTRRELERAATPESLALRRAEVLVRLGVPTTVLGASALAFWFYEGAPWTKGQWADRYGCGGYRTLGVTIPLIGIGLVSTVVGAVRMPLLRRAGVKPAPSSRAARIIGISLWTLGSAAAGAVSLFADNWCNS